MTFCSPRSLPWFISLLAVVLGSGGFLPELRAESGEESKRRLKMAEKEIDHLRDNLHEAQRELAAKTERIEDLERELEKWKRSGTTEASEEKRGKSKAKPKSSAPEKSRKVPQPPKPAPALQQKAPAFEVLYDANSAVNYEGRDRALAWMRAQITGPSSLRFEVRGWADDSEYPEANRTIAMNRAKFLADYLVLSGIPREKVVSVGVGEGKGGRRARILSVESPAAEAEATKPD